MEIPDRLLLDIYEGAQHCMPSDFNEHALNAFKKIVHFDSALIADLAVTEERKFAIHGLHLHATPAERFYDRLKAIGAETINRNGTVGSRDPAFRKAIAQRGNSVIVDITQTNPSPEILNYCRRYGTTHALTHVSDKAWNNTISTLSFSRGSKKNAFLEKHGHAANIVLPHIFQAKEINRRLNKAPAAGLHGRTTMLATLDGCLYFGEPEAISLLQLEWKEWAPPFLPRSLIDSLKDNRERTFVGAAISVKASVQGKMICLDIFVGTNDTLNLTAAEYRAARLAAEGMQYKKIAQQLGISPATVRNQLHAVYRKLGVSNKTALAAALPS